MVSVHGLTMFFWQTPYDGSAHDIHWIMIAELAIAGIMVLLLIGALVAGVTAIRLMKRVDALIDETQQKCTPIITKTAKLLDDVGPKVRSITTNVEQISFTARDKVDELAVTVSELNKTVTDLNIKARAQANRVDGLVTEALNTTQQVSQSIQHSIRVPINKIAGIVAGVKTGIERFMESSPLTSRFRPQPRTTGYEASNSPKPPYDL